MFPSPQKSAIKCIILGLIICLICVEGSYWGYHYIRHEKWQSEEIHRLSIHAEKLEESLDIQSQKIENLTKLLNELEEPEISWLDNGINYLAIGNSITSRSLAKYWWNDGVGMAASSEDKDYVHQIRGYLENTYNEPVKMQAYNFYTWEVQAADRGETLQLLDGYLSDKLDLITIQLSENVHDISTFEEDCEELFSYIMKKAPEAQIIVIDDFCDSGEKSELKKRAAKECNVGYISLDEMKGDPRYQAGLGTIVYDKDGKEHIIEHEGVASHPGDTGMTYIAEAVEKKINIQSDTGSK